MRPKRASSGPVEWVGALVDLPVRVVEGGRAHEPRAVIWMVVGGPVVGIEVLEPDGPIEAVAEHLLATMQSPMAGSPHVPNRIRVAEPDVAETLRAFVPRGTTVVCSATPELDDIAEALRARFGSTELSSYLVPGVDADAMAGFFRATATLFRAAPWSVVPDDSSLFAVSVDALGLHDAALSVIGQLGENRGLLLFEGLGAFGEFLEGARAMQRGEEPELPAYLALHYESAPDVATGLREEIERHGWEVAGETAYPALLPSEPGAPGRPPTPEEVGVVEAIALAVAEAMESRAELLRAFAQDKPWRRTFRVTARGGPVDVALCAPFRVTETAPQLALFDEPADADKASRRPRRKR